MSISKVGGIPPLPKDHISSAERQEWYKEWKANILKYIEKVLHSGHITNFAIMHCMSLLTQPSEENIKFDKSQQEELANFTSTYTDLLNAINQGKTDMGDPVKAAVDSHRVKDDMNDLENMITGSEGYSFFMDPTTGRPSTTGQSLLDSLDSAWKLLSPDPDEKGNWDIDLQAFWEKVCPSKGQVKPEDSNLLTQLNTSEGTVSAAFSAQSKVVTAQQGRDLNQTTATETTLQKIFKGYIDGLMFLVNSTNKAS